MLTIKKTAASFFLMVVMLPFLSFGATPPLSGSAGTTTGGPSGDTIPISWNITLNNGVYTYVYNIAGADPTSSYGIYPQQFFLQLDPSITAANFSSIITNLTVTNASATTSIGSYNLGSGSGTYYGVLFNATSFGGLHISFKTNAVPVYGNIVADGTTCGLDSSCSPGQNPFVTVGTGVFATVGAVAAPEPTTWALLASSVGLIALVNSKRRTSKVV